MTNLPSDADLQRAAAFLDSVKGVFDSAKVAESDMENNVKAGNKVAADAKADARNLDREAKGFERPKLKALASVGGLYARAYLSGNTGSPMPGHDAALQAAAESYLRVFTNRGGKTAKGGTGSGFRTIIAQGVNAERIRAALAGRVAHYTAIFDSKPEGESKEARTERLYNAARFMTPARCDGDKPAHLGGESRAVNGIFIGNADGKRRGGTNIDSQFAMLARFYADHGENALHPDVVDAVLDNGGAVLKVDSIESTAKKAADAINALLESFGGRVSGDGAFLSHAASILGRIAEEGVFKGNGAAAPVVVEAPPAPPAPPAVVEAPGESVPGGQPAGNDSAESSAQDVLDSAVNEVLAADPADATGTKPARRGRGSLQAA